MASFILSCCSAADLTKAHFDSRGIRHICFHYRLGGREYPDDLGQTLSFPDFYRAAAAGADTGTSQINVSEYLDFFEQFLSQGLDVLHVTLSSGISGTWSSASDAACICRERYPERKIYVVDSLGASSGYGLLMDALADRRDEGMDIDALRDWAEENRLRLHHWFFSADLSHYVRGGRISRAAGLFGTMLNVCPLMNMDGLGKLILRHKHRGKRKVILEIVKKMEQHAENGTDYREKVYISHSDCLPDARAVADLIEERFPKLDGKVEINWVGSMIGCHTGPGTVALFFWGDRRLVSAG